MKDLLEAFGPDRRISLCRELTKLHEEVLRMTLGEAVAYCAQQPPRGEYVLIVEGAAEIKMPEPSLEDALSRVSELMAAGLTRKDAVRQVSGETGLPKNTLYEASVK